MIKLIPVEDKLSLQKLAEKYQLPYSESLHAYVSASQDVFAECLFSLEGYSVNLLAIDFDEADALLPEMLIRAVGAYAGNRSGYLFLVNQPIASRIQSTLKTMHFEENEKGFCGKVPVILKGSCCHQDNE